MLRLSTPSFHPPFRILNPCKTGPLQGWQRRLLPGWLRRNWPVLQRLLVTLGMLVVIRLGYFIPVPGVDLGSLPAAAYGMEGERMMRALYGQAQALPASLFELGISPHINASIIVSMLLILPKDVLPFPWAARLREARKEGKGGEALINDRINYLALGFALYTGVTRALELAPYALYSQGFVVQTTLALVAGSFMIHHCANTITAAGVGNGSTLVICMGIITEYASTLHQVLVGLESASLAAWKLGSLLAGYLGLLLFTVYLSSSEVRLPIVQYSKAPPPEPPQPGAAAAGGRQELLSAARALLDRKASAAGQQGAHFPLLLNSSGVMPMIIASAAFYGILPKAAEFVGLVGVANFIYGLQATGWGLLVYGLLVFAMEFLPFGAVNPPEVAEYFTMIDVGVKGVAPGYATQQFLAQKLRQCKFWGGMALAGLAVSANLFDQLCLSMVGTTLATTSLVIIVGAVMQTSRQVESLMEGPRLQHKLDNERYIIQSLST
ncbi:pre protein translocase secY subunit [Scenedesmus sp. NREL 46B-D3]|nr:pre protein translocase secY subunit [Scenedesmus sp. NREL 46B-D3]